MEGPNPAPPPGRKKIRLSRAEAHALGLAAPRKKGLAFGSVALLLAAALGLVLWHFRDFWLPDWLPQEIPAPSASVSNEEAPRAAESPEVSRPSPANAPAPVPIGDSTAPSQTPLAEIRRQAPAGDAAAVDDGAVLASERQVAPPPGPGKTWPKPGYLEGAQLFNQALEQYRLFLADKTRTELLKPIEEAAFQAAKKFEALKGQAPEGVALNENITQCYKLISDCRRQNLEGAGTASAGGNSGRGTVGPHRRPPLPPYQPPP